MIVVDVGHKYRNLRRCAMLLLHALALGAQAITLSPNDKFVRSLQSNVDLTYGLSKYNPKFFIADGCRPVVRYSKTDVIDFDGDVCANNFGQVYGKIAIDRDFQVVLIYAWQQQITVSNWRGWDWSWMAVWPGANKATAIWTPVGGYTQAFSSDNGIHPYIEQRRPIPARPPGFDKAKPSDRGGVFFSLIDVDQVNGEWTAAAKSAFQNDLSPISGHRLSMTLDILKYQKRGYGYPGYTSTY